MYLKPFKSIGIGVAFSPNLKANLFEAARLSVFFKAKLVLIHVGEASEEKTNVLSTCLKSFEKDNLDYEVVFKPGDPVNVILSTSEEKKIDLLILGAVKREKVVKYYVGSIARKITRQAKCSILLLIKPSVESNPCKHIVVNGLKDPKTEQTITAAFYVANHVNSEKITIVEEIDQEEIHVKVEDDKSLRRANIVKERIKLRENSRVNEIIKHIPEEYTKNKTIKLQPIFGKRGYSIGHYAQISRADLLIMNSPSKMTFWDRLFPHDIEHILTELPTDVLILQ
ncbi:universal stress protein [Algibacter amylolyticus]|uniref:Universal stress protein n=1 Tax=Algibacter amylolyticus TaxID=1608400 RepID=A0A5M7BDA9_9FLAO|nr:universal stress protein [Algibacter amylolyticus]KAA5827472.1 universal stress protein [Algibacter amylolyticus]MBB5266669.1 nucleotide-binding universal stress UspA family protein [Algibacter amylolyticus]TSJ81717.1 universal stress protein [Algibacter amylolyticus]